MVGDFSKITVNRRFSICIENLILTNELANSLNLQLKDNFLT